MKENRINFVINSLDPYQYEIVNLLALPSGSKFRFRYQDKWIDKNCFSKNLLKNGLNGFIFLNHASKFLGDAANSDKKDSNEKFFSEYYPLRKIKYIKHEEVGSICYFECELLDYFNYPNNKFIGSDDNKRINSSLNREDGALVFVDANDRDLVNKEANEPDTNIDNRSWVRTVEALSAVDALSHLDFYRISGIRCTNSAKDSLINNKNGIFDLYELDSYELVLTQWRKTTEFSKTDGSDKRGIRVVETSHVTATQPFAMALGKYDILKLAITLPAVIYKTKSFLQLDYFVIPSVERIMDNSIRLPIVINKKPVSIIKRVVLLLTLCVAYLAPNLFPLFLDQDFSIDGAQLLRDLSIIAVTITLVDLYNVSRKK
jgi:hypothetical protein